MYFLLKMSAIVLLCLTTSLTNAQDFPSIDTETAAGNELQIPSDLEGKKSIVFLAFTQQAEQVLEDWYYPVYTMFIDESGFNALAYDCHVKLVMMFTGIGQSLSNGIVEKLKENVDPSMEDYLLFYQGNFKDQMDELGLQKKDDAYVFVLDEEGKIIFQESGNYSEKKLDKIASLVEL